VDELKVHPFFAGLDWDNVYHTRIIPELVTEIAADTDTESFHSECTEGETGNMPVCQFSFARRLSMASLASIRLSKLPILGSKGVFRILLDRGAELGPEWAHD
jgi:hypothetical protein